MDKYNRENAQSAEKNLQDLLQLSMTQMANQQPLTDAEKAQAEQYGKLLIDAKG